MFVILCIGVVAVVFWISAVVAEVLLASPAERALAPGVRAGFGFIVCLVYFSAAWQVLAIEQAWVIGLALLALRAASRSGVGTPRAWMGTARGLWSGYRLAFAAFLGAALVFFLPLVAQQGGGPFTEGGGDVSIYADTTKYLVDRDLTEFGLPSRDAADLGRNLHELALQGRGERAAAERSPLMNPPFAEYAAHRVLVKRTMSPFLYAPYATYSFLAGPTNYHVFYGVQAFAYGCLLAGMWGFFRRYGRRVAAAGVVLAAGSHGLISVFYNTYGAQGLAIAMCALVLAALGSVRLFSWAALRTYGCVLLLTWIGYVHYLSVLLPLVAIAGIPAGPGAVQPAGAARTTRSPLARLAAGLPMAAFAVAFAALAWAGTREALAFASNLVALSLAGKESKEYLDLMTYMGAPVKAFGTQWFAFLFGFASQQHFQPYAAERAWLPHALRLGAGAGVLCFATGAVAMARWFAARRDAPRSVSQDLAIYLVALLTIVLHLFIAQSSLYTQAKGAQNELVLVFTVLLLPLALSWRDLPAAGSPWLRRSLVAALVAFAGALLAVRCDFAYRLASQLDRSGILDPSFFAEAERIRRADPDPLVLFEPRRSADLYTSNQPFFGARMLPTRELILQRAVPKAGGGYDRPVAMAVEFVGPGDLSHVWTLRASARGWRAERLVDARAPALVLSGDTFERPYGELRLGATPDGALAPFSFMRNGVVSLYLPGQAARVEVELQAREGEYAILEAEIRRRIEAGEFGPDAKMAATGKVVSLAYSIPATGSPTLRTIARARGEFFVNVKVDGKDLG